MPADRIYIEALQQIASMGEDTWSLADAKHAALCALADGPDVPPESGEEQDWPDVQIAKTLHGREVAPWVTFGAEEPSRRYIPAPEGSESDA